MRIGRRRFLLMLGGASAAGVLGLRLRRGSAPEVSRTGHALGAKVSIRIRHADSAVAGRALDAAFEELEHIEAALSLYRDDSDLCRLNRDGRLREPDPRLLDVLRCSQSVARRSDGALDVTVQPLWELHAEAWRSHAPPGDDDLREICRHVDWRRLEIGSREVRLESTDMAVTLNGIAQGYAADRVRAVLQTFGIRHALVDAGEFAGLGARADGDPWCVGIQHPNHADSWIDLARLDSRCLATSAGYATTFDEAGRAHHIFDPRSGRCADRLASVSVMAPTAMEADALSTAVFVMGAERGQALLAATPGVDALLVTREDRILTTGGFPRA